jgi:hypothetical protein
MNLYGMALEALQDNFRCENGKIRRKSFCSGSSRAIAESNFTSRCDRTKPELLSGDWVGYRSFSVMALENVAHLSLSSRTTPWIRQLMFVYSFLDRITPAHNMPSHEIPFSLAPARIDPPGLPI